MKHFHLILAFLSIFLTTTITLEAQVANNLVSNRIMDVANPHYLWAQQTDSTSLLLGLTEDNDYYSLKDNSIWLVNNTNKYNKLLISLNTSLDNSLIFFCKENENDPELKIDTIGSYNTITGQIIDNKNELMFLFLDNTIIDKKGNSCLLVGDEVNKTLAAYFAFSFYNEELNKETLRLRK